MIAACGNGTAGIVAPEALRRIGAEVIADGLPNSTTLSRNTIPIPKISKCCMRWRMPCASRAPISASASTATAIAAAWSTTRAMKSSPTRSACCVARDLSARHPNAKFVVDVKSTGSFETDPVLKKNGAVDRLLEDRPFLHQAAHGGARRARGLREERTLFLQPADRPWL